MPINETAVWRRRLPSAVLSFIASEESEKSQMQEHTEHSPKGTTQSSIGGLSLALMPLFKSVL